MPKNDLAKIFLYFATVLFFGALFAPWLFDLGKGIVNFRVLP